jgi:hypothetical protein
MLLELGGDDSAVVEVRCALLVRTSVIWWWVFFATSGFVAGLGPLPRWLRRPELVL